MSHEHDAPDNELKAIESALGELVPARSRMDRDSVMFQAGQATARRTQAGPRVWMAVAASFAILAVGEGALLAHRPSSGVVERIVVVHEPAPVSAPPASAAKDDSAPALALSRPADRSFGMGRTPYDRLAWQVLRYGLDGLPASPPAASSDPGPWPAPSRRWLEQELRKDLDPGDPS